MMIASLYRRRGFVTLAALLCGLGAHPALAGFASTEVFLPAVGRAPGAGGAQIYTTVWATNLTQAPETFTFHFLRQGQSNATAEAPIAPSQAGAALASIPAQLSAATSFSDTLAPGETKVYENVVESKLGLTDALGAARVTSSGEIFVSERIYNQAPGADVGNTEGLFFAGVPKSFSISTGQSASIQGIDQGGSENFRYNFALIETGGGSPTIHVQVFGGDGTLLGQKSYALLPYEQIQTSVADVVPEIATTNARITATVTVGTGSVLLAGAQLANESQDSSGFEMTFRDELLGGIGTGAAVIHDSTLLGNGTSGAPLGMNPASVVTSLNGLPGGLTLAAGSNVTITPSGSTLTIASTGGSDSGGFKLPFSGSTDDPNAAFTVTDTNGGTAIQGISDVSGNTVMGVYGECKYGYGVYGSSNSAAGVDGNSIDGSGVRGTSFNGYGVEGIGPRAGVYGFGGDGYGVHGQTSKSSEYALYADGSIGATGTKTFVEPHPTDPTKEIRYVCLEGPESGTYFRGTGRIVGGFATIEVPEDFRMVSSDKGLTVQLTALGAPASLWVASENLDRINLRGSSDVEFHYTVNGVRKAFEDFRPFAENRDFVPRSANDERFAVGLPAESLRRLKASGILNSDGSINLETAHRLGWDERDGWKRAETKTERH